MDFTNVFNNLVEKLQGWLEAAILGLPNFVAAVVIVFVFALAAKLVRRLVLNGMDRVSSYRQVNRLIATVAYVALIITGVFVALGILELDKTVTSLLAGVGIIGLALGFAFQDIASNFISGVLLSIRRPFREGDLVKTNDHFGLINEVNLRATHVRTPQGQIVIIPNSNVFQSPIVNYSRLGMRRVDVGCGVAYGDDLETARRVAIEAIEGVSVRDAKKDVELFYEEFGDSSINFVVRFWIDFSSSQADYLRARSEAIMRLKSAFDEHGITIPFPIRTLDFGVVGGVNLDEVLPKQFYERSNGNTPAGDVA